MLLDTSVAVALLVVDHEAHAAVLAELPDEPLGLSGHAAFETYAVLTRMPGRVTPAVAARLLDVNFPASVACDVGPSDLDLFARAGIAGGQTYDALVGLAARKAERPLLTRDRRALPTYNALQVDVRLLD